MDFIIYEFERERKKIRERKTQKKTPKRFSKFNRLQKKIIIMHNKV